jgi:hypothetical protein
LTARTLPTIRSTPPARPSRKKPCRNFRWRPNSYAPEFGRATGGIINVVTKRGTNEYSGNLFGFIRDKSVQARNPFAPFKSAFTRTQFGGTLGGPLPFLNFGEGGPVTTGGRDKNFFFVSFRTPPAQRNRIFHERCRAKSNGFGELFR